MFEKYPILVIIASIITSIAGLIIVFHFIRFLLKKYAEYIGLHDYKNELKDKIIPSINEKLEPIPVMKNEMTVMKDEMTAMKDRIDKIYEKLFDIELVKSKSPTQLATKGEKFAKELKAYELIKKHKSQFMKKIENIEKLNPYTIQQESKRVIYNYLRKMISDDDLLIIENKVFQEGILFDDILPVYSIILRDEILKDRGLGIKHIDKYDPNKKK